MDSIKCGWKFLNYFILFVFGISSLHGQTVEFNLVTPNEPLPITGAGTRFFWYSSKAAFRAGKLVTRPNNWDEDKLGLRSVALGSDVAARGNQSFAWGLRTDALGTRSTAGGQENFAKGNSSLALGFQLVAPSFGEVALGSKNTDYPPLSSIIFQENDRLLSVGNGDVTESNALEIYKNGNMILYGSLALTERTLILAADNQTVDVEINSRIKVGSDNAIPTSRTARLSNGYVPGQILIIECGSCLNTSWELLDEESPGGNLNLPVATRTFTDGTMMQLLWNGAEWLEVSFTDN